MEENLNSIPEIPQQPPKLDYTARGREFAYGGMILLLSVLLCNFVFYGGFHLAFGITGGAAILCSWLYLKQSGHRFGSYEKTLLILSLIICLGFGRSDDGFVKFVMLLFLFTAVNLALCLAAGQNRRDPNGAMSLLDAPRALFNLGFGGIGRSTRGLSHGIKNGGAATRKFGAVTTGLLISVPILVVMISLLMDADAAFEGLMDLLPDVKMEEYINSALWGLGLALILYTRGVALHRSAKPAESKGRFPGINALTVNTVLIAVCLVYLVYLFSQLAYLSGGLSGILPEAFTMAEYARRGFFEMAWLCALNLTVICGSVWLVKNKTGMPVFTKLCGAFIGAVTIFLVTTASAKMLMYIGSYGLTRLRVLTEIIMVWLGLTTVLVTVWLFIPKLPYMKFVVLAALVMGTAVLWADVDTQVAKYNVRAYQSGQLETVDVDYLYTLSSGAVPYLHELAEDPDSEIAGNARFYLELLARRSGFDTDWRGWNWTAAAARQILENYREG